jgi:hypothetical protein
MSLVLPSVAVLSAVLFAAALLAAIGTLLLALTPSSYPSGTKPWPFDG